ncbi:hypothetical protein SANBI_000211 [Sanguibacter sp. 4.1]|uniref:ABC3 transporter permease C-terminal domain-containing protein n=1 Tax=Sanguibacter biliveldensis TaxID=3030830 RepID=A0AAF0Z830_9MICO|nr:FtsX-like permease family protein [Sanguibacter sp. 4.1]WPF82601.1 hypothetical protein SANBI_000211 [Sanguibacter sp. 4.1]
MTATWSLWRLLRRRGASSSDPQRLTTTLAIIAFAVATALLLVVLGGVGAFVDRAAAPGADADAESYVMFAWIASGLLVVPLTTLGAAAARLAVARRDARLAALRLAGASTGQVTGLTVLDATAQAVTGALLGVVGYLALIPLVSLLRFQGRTFELAELWTGVPIILAALAGVVLIAVVSSTMSLRRVAITPLGVANRVQPPGLTWLRAAVAVGAVIVFAVVTTSFGQVGLSVIGVMLVLGFTTLNLVGPFTVWVVGRVTAHRARTAATLLAGRRMIDDPKTAWRSVGGVALATFIAGLASITSLFSSASSGASPEDAQFLGDVATGGYLTLGIAGLLAAVSTGVMQAGNVIAQREEYRALSLAGTDLRVLDSARMRETFIPLVVTVGTSAGFALLFMLPVLGAGMIAQWSVVVQFVVSVGVAAGLVLAGAAASRTVVREVVRV